MMTEWKQLATRLNHPHIQRWKQEGKPVIGYSCSYLPAELVHAAGILPVRLRGIETSGMEIGDAYFGPYICSFPKCVLQLAGQGKYAFLDGVVITPGCDSMRRLFECWRKAGEDHAGIVPSFFYYLDVPHKTVEHRMQWFVDQISGFKTALESHFSLQVSEEALHQSIGIYNTGRRLMNQLEQLRTQTDPLISGTEAFTVSIAGTSMDRESFNRSLQTYLEECRTPGESPHRGKKRLMVIGSISDDLELIQLIERDEQAVVVTENLCFGVRHDAVEVSEQEDPLHSLAKAYLESSTCPRMFGKYQERLAVLRDKIDRYSVDGVILQNIRFCDLHGSENGLFERDLENQGVPCLRLEREYGPLTETGRLKMRIDAFLERLSRTHSV